MESKETQFIPIDKAIKLFDNDTDEKPLVDLFYADRNIGFLREGINFTIRLAGEHKGEVVFTVVENERDHKLLEIAMADAFRRVKPDYDWRLRQLRVVNKVEHAGSAEPISDDKIAKLAGVK